MVITPTNPEVVYVPQYDPTTVQNNSLGNAVAAGAVAFGTFVVLDAIFNDDDYWGGCRWVPELRRLGQPTAWPITTATA